MREIKIGAITIKNELTPGTSSIPLLKGDTGYSISRVTKTSGSGAPGTYDTYTIYINTVPETSVGSFQVYNGTGNIGDMTKAEYDTDNDGIVDNAERVNNHTVDIDVPSNAKFTDTVYDDTAITNRVTTLENAGYITKSVSDLVNYYTKTETYTKQEVNTLVDTIPKFAIEVVNSLPVTDISTTTIYLVRDDSQTGDIYQEFIYVNNTWELLGAQRIDLSNYYTKSETYAKTETYNKTEVDNAIASIEGNEVIITDDPTELDNQKIWIDTSSNATYINQEVNIGATNPNNIRTWFKKSNNLFNNLVVSNTSNGASGSVINTGIRAKVTTAGANKYVGYKLPNPERLLGKVVTISATITKSGSNDGLIRFYWGNNDTITTNINSTITTTGSQTFTMPSAFPSGSNQILIVFSATASNTGAVNDYVDYTNVMLEYGKTATPYTQYGLNSINVDNEEIYSTPVTLYNGSTTDNSITLSDNINNYKYYEIVFHRGNGYSSVKMPTTILSNISLTTCQYASDLFRMYNANISISGTTLTKNYARYVNFTSNSCSSSDDASNFYIDKVIGYN